MTDQQGTDFWVGFPADSYPTTVDTLEVLITSPNVASGQVDVPGIGYSSPFTVPAGGSVALTLPHGALVTIGDGTTAQGVHVTSSSLVSVYGMDYQPATTDGYLALPTVADGTGYYDLSYNASVSWTQGSSFLVVGTQNSTSVTINPVITVGARTAGVPYIVTLNQGDTYQLLAPTPGTDLSGSSINSDKPIAVFGACQIADIPVTVGQGNYLVEQLWPLVDWGTDFFTRPFSSATVSYRYLASVDNTTVNVNGAFFATLNAGQFVEQGAINSQSKEVTADHPIYVMEYGYGLYYGGGDGDPSMATIPPVDHWASQYLFPEDLNVFTNPQHYVNLVVPASATNGVTLDGTPIPSFNFQAVNGGPYYSAVIPVSFTTPHSLTCAVSFMALPYMLDIADAYSFPAGGLFVDNGPTPTPIPSPTPFPPPNPCKVLVYYDGEPGAASVTNLVNLLQVEGAIVTTLGVTTTTYNPASDNWNNYGQVWDARFMPFVPFGGCPISPVYANYDYVSQDWANCMVSYLRTGGNLYVAAESDIYTSRYAGLGPLLRVLGVVTNTYVSCPNSSQGDDSSLGQVTLPSTLPGAPNFFGDVVGGIPLANMTNPGSSLVHMSTGWTHVNEDRSIVQGWSGAAQLPGLAGSNVGKLLMVWDTDMWTPGDYSGVNGTTTNNFFTQVFYWLGGNVCGGATPTPLGVNTATTTPTASPTGTITPTSSVSPTPTPSSTPTDSPTPTGSWTLTATPTATGTLPPTSTPSYTPSYSPTFTWTTTPSGTPTFTATPTPTPNCQMHLWPNPFDPRRAFNHALKFGCLPLGARVSIYTLSGEWVGDAQTVAADEAQWNGSNQNGAPASAGIYFYLIQNGSAVVDKGKILLVR